VKLAVLRIEHSKTGRADRPAVRRAGRRRRRRTGDDLAAAGFFYALVAPGTLRGGLWLELFRRGSQLKVYR
jgi:hypothetical protein